MLIDKEREETEMRKVEIINRMIILGIIKEEDRNHFMRKDKERLMKIYIDAVPTRLEYLGRI